jgi:uncharacterized protein
MHENFKTLLQVNELDTKIINLENSKKTLPAKIEKLKTKVTAESSRLNQLRSAIKLLEEQISENQSTLDDEKIALGHSNERLNSISTNREYDAVHAEIVTHSERIKNLEEKILTLSEDVDDSQTKLPELEKKFEEISLKNQPEIDKLQAELDAIDAHISEKNAELKKLKKGLESEFLNYYERLVKSKKPLLLGNKQQGVVAIIKDGSLSCNVCFRSFTRQKVQMVKRGGLQTCDNCGSLLIWIPEK